MKKKYNWTAEQTGLYGLICFAVGIIMGGLFI